MGLGRSNSRMSSKSSLWNLWTWNPAADYERSLHKFSWLATDREERSSEQAALRPPIPPLLSETAYSPWEPAPRRHYHGQVDPADLERGSLDMTTDNALEGLYNPSSEDSADESTDAAAEDPNLVGFPPRTVRRASCVTSDHSF
jgi:hypothetical protein